MTTPTLDDNYDLPEAPTATNAHAADDVPFGTHIDAEVSEELWDSVPAERQAIPKGTYHFRLDSYTEETSAKGPYFATAWKCQTEPHVGRTIFDNVPWVMEETVKTANDVNHPDNRKARETLKDRLWKARQIAKACGYRVSGGFNLKKLLDTNPEARIETRPKEGAVKEKQKDGTEKWVGTGVFDRNEVVKYLPL